MTALSQSPNGSAGYAIAYKNVNESQVGYRVRVHSEDHKQILWVPLDSLPEGVNVVSSLEDLNRLEHGQRAAIPKSFAVSVLGWGP